MQSNFEAWSDKIKELCSALDELIPKATSLGVPKPDGHEWHELLYHKLLSQLKAQPFLVVSIVGGTNIGKSVLFNHLAGEVASAVSPLAAETKHPVCLVPTDMDDTKELSRVFDQFVLQRWHSAEDPLKECEKDLLFWRASSNVPPRLLMLDAPDVDSDVQVNWKRAKAIRQVADVVIAVLTQQKYNDAAVKRFFREATLADKPIIVVFNQCEIDSDREYWPKWLATFCGETGTKPELVYVLPRDRKAAEKLQLPFYDVGVDGQQEPTVPVNLRNELASLHFDSIKIRTFRGAMARVLDHKNGAQAYLYEVQSKAKEFEVAAKSLSATEMARVAWPSLPASVFVKEIRKWWNSQRHGWSRKIHGFYRTVGRRITWPIRVAWHGAVGDGTDPLVAWHQNERDAVLLAVEKLLDELERLSQVGCDTLRPRLLELLGGSAREKLLEKVKEAHDTLPPVDDDYREFLQTELDTWGKANTRVVQFLRSLDHVAAVARPAITVSLAVSGWAIAGDLVGQAAVNVAGHTAGELATEAAITGGITGGGEAVVSATGEGVRQASGRLFGKLQERYAQHRAKWLADWIESELLGNLLNELRQGAEVSKGEAFHQAELSMQQIRDLG